MSALPTEIRRHLDAIRRAVRSHGLWQPGQGVLVACSGGRDSMALLGLLCALRPSLKHHVVAAHVDHGLQPNHLDMMEIVRQQSVKLGVPFASAAVIVRPGADLEGRARLLRYGALQRLADSHQCAVIVTAHHADDQAETLLMRLARGVGPNARAGVRRKRVGEGVPVVRPVLDLSRADLAACADWLKTPWVEDPSNASADPTRNRLRHRVLPELEAAVPGAASGLSRSTALAAEQEGALDAWLDHLLSPHITAFQEEGTLRVPQDRIPAPPAARAALLPWIATKLGAPAPSARAVAQWLTLGRKETARFRGLDVRGDGESWHFRVFDVAHPPAAD